MLQSKNSTLFAAGALVLPEIAGIDALCVMLNATFDIRTTKIKVELCFDQRYLSGAEA